MSLPITLLTYIARQFILYFSLVFIVFSVLVLLADSVEILRRAFGKEIPWPVMIGMIFSKYPMMVQKLLPFVMLFGGMLAFYRLSRSSELIVTRASGISIWQILFAPICSTIILGIFIITIFNPFASIITQHYEQIEAKYLRGQGSLLTVSQSGLWLKQQADIIENGKDGEVIIHALRAVSKSAELYDVIIFIFSKKGQFVRRIDSKVASLNEGFWKLQDAIITSPGKQTEIHSEYFLKTNLSLHQIQDSFASPETLSFWSLPGFIKLLQEAGFPATKHRLHWHSLMTVPLMLVAMVLLSAVFTLHAPKQKRVSVMIFIGIVCGFIVFLMTDIINAFGLSGNIPIMLAAWAPSVITTMIGLGMLLHLEDG